jgi:hypothetical protein
LNPALLIDRHRASTQLQTHRVDQKAQTQPESHTQTHTETHRHIGALTLVTIKEFVTPPGLEECSNCLYIQVSSALGT